MSWRRHEPLQSPPPRASTPSAPGKADVETRWGHKPQNAVASNTGKGQPRKDPCIQAALSPKQDENEEIVLLLRDAAKQDHHRLSYAELEAEQEATGLQELISVLQSHKRADPDLPFSGLQLMRLARSVKMFCGLPDVRSLAILAAEEMISYAALTTVMHNTRFAVWSGLLLGLVGVHAEHARDSSPPPKLVLLAEMAVQELSSTTEQWVFAPGQGARTVSQFLWALGKLGYDPSGMTDFMDTLECVACSEPELLQGANAQDLAMLVWSLARLMPASARCMSVWSGALDGLGSIIQSAQPVKTQDLSNPVWGLASAVNEGLEPPKNSRHFLGAVSEAVKSGAMERALPQEWSNLLWGLGRLKATQAGGRLGKCGLLEVAMRATSKLLPTFVPQAFSNSLWGLAALEAVNDSKAPDLAITAMDIMTTKLKSFNPQDIGNSLWAITNLIPQSRCITVDDSSFMLKERDYEQHVFPLLEAVASHISNKDKMRGATTQNWTNICWAFATLGVYIPSAFNAALTGVLDIVKKTEMPPERLNAVLHPCVAVSHDEPDLHQLWGLTRKAILVFPPHTCLPPPESIASTLYSWAALSASCGPNERPDATAVARSFFDAAANLSIQDIPEKALGALALAHIEACDVELPGGGLPEGIVRNVALARWISRKSEDQVTSSAFQIRVAKAAERAGVRRIQLEAASSDQLHRVDIALFWPVPKHSEQLLTHVPEYQRMQTAQGSYVLVSIECDGPFHFLAWPPGHVNGSTRIRDRQLARRFPVSVAISWTSWESTKCGEASLNELVKRGSTRNSGISCPDSSSIHAGGANADEGTRLRPGFGAASSGGKPSSSLATADGITGGGDLDNISISLRPGASATPTAGKPSSSLTQADGVAGGSDLGDSISLRPGGVSGLRWGARGMDSSDVSSDLDAGISLRPGGVSGLRWGACSSAAQTPHRSPAKLGTGHSSISTSRIAPGAGSGAVQQSLQQGLASPSKSNGDVELDSKAKWLAQALDQAVVQALSKPGSCIRL